MNHLFQVTVYTGQQLVLEGIHRWLRKPCTEDHQQRQRRTGLKGLLVLLFKTAATGVLATILDAAIEYRRRQLLLLAQEETASSSADVSRFPGFSVLSRAGIAAWKTRLLVAIDEMERQAGNYGIEPTHRFDTSHNKKDGGNNNGTADDKGKALVTDTSLDDALAVDLLGEEDDEQTRQAMLSKTVEQLRELVKQDDEEAERQFDERVEHLLDSLLGVGLPTPPLTRGPSTLSLDTYSGAHTSSHHHKSASKAGHSKTSDVDSDSDDVSTTMCHICMDREVRVLVEGCNHDLCFQCARRLCATHDHSVPQCPFCRQTINGFLAIGAPTGTTSHTVTV